MACKLPILVSAAVLLFLFAPISSSSLTSYQSLPPSASEQATYNNVLNSGNTLKTGSSLAHGKYSFIMQEDCNLVLYDDKVATWSSRTDGVGANCTLLMQTTGELFINNGSGFIVWRSETGGDYGHYALVLQPNGDVVVYGSPVWSTGTYTATKRWW